MSNNTIIQKVQEALRACSPNDISLLYKKTAHSEVLTQMHVMKLVYGMKAVESCSDRQLHDLAVALGLYESSGEDGATSKQQFFDNLTVSNVNIYKAHLKRFKWAEGERDADLTEWPKQDLLQEIEREGIYNRGTLRQLVTAISKYAEWRKQNGKSVNEFWHGEGLSVNDISLVEAMRKNCVQDPIGLCVRFAINKNSAPEMILNMCAVLAWVGFSLEEMVALKNEAVSPDCTRIDGRTIPIPMQRLVRIYTSCEDLDDLGYLVKRPLPSRQAGRPINKAYISTQFATAGIMSHSDISMSAKYYELWSLENESSLTTEDIANVFKIKNDQRTAAMVDRLAEYQAYKEAFHIES